MAALIKASKAEDYPANIKLVISNRPDALGLEKARDLGVKAVTIDHTVFKTRKAFDAQMDMILRENDIEFIACAGFMRILGTPFVKAWAGHLINIHPSLLPKHRGLNTHQKALEAGDVHHGCSVHWVTEELDAGKIIAQASLTITPQDSRAGLAQRVKSLEHELYPQALKKALTQD